MRNPTTEAWLKEHGVEFKYTPNLDLSKIDRASSRHNQARIGAPIDDDTVLTYAAAMENGDDFPPLVVYESSGRKYVVIDGNHRDEAATLARPERTSFASYVVKGATENQIRILTYEANARNGRATSLTERIRQAIHMIEMGVHPREAARSLALPFARVQTAWETFYADKRLSSLNIRNPEKIGAWARRRLNAVRSDRVLRQVAALAIKAGWDNAFVNDTVTTINKYRNEDEQVKYIKSLEKRFAPDIAVTVGGKVQIPHSVRYLTQVLSRVENLDPDKYVEFHKAAPAEYREQLAQKVKAAQSRLSEVADRLTG